MRHAGNATAVRWLAAGTLLAVVLIATGAAWAATSGPTFSSPFTASNEGWLSYDGGVSTKPMTWQSSGGNPGGYITNTFPHGLSVIEPAAGTSGSTWRPTNALNDYGGTLAADIQVHLNSATSDEDLQIGFESNNTRRILCEDFGQPTATWATYTVMLDASHLIDCESGKPVSGATVRAALAGFKAIDIDATNFSNVGEVVDVDNAELSPPEIGEKPPTGSVKRALTLKYAAHKLSGTLTAAEDYSCAGKVKVTIFEKSAKPLKVGTVTTSAPNLNELSGPATFSLTLPKSATGKFYAAAAKATSKLDGNSCRAVESKTVAVH